MARICPRTGRERAVVVESPELETASDLRLTLERVTRIELALSAWEADVLPLNYTRTPPRLARDGLADRTASHLPPILLQFIGGIAADR